MLKKEHSELITPKNFQRSGWLRFCESAEKKVIQYPAQSAPSSQMKKKWTEPNHGPGQIWAYAFLSNMLAATKAIIILGATPIGFNSLFTESYLVLINTS